MPEANEPRAGPAAAAVGSSSLPRAAAALASPPAAPALPTGATPAPAASGHLKEPYTRPLPSSYTHPIVTVNRHASHVAGAAGPPHPGAFLARPPTTPATPPFIISNSLAAASGLHLGARRAPGVAAPAVAAAGAPGPRPPVPSAPAARLPPQKDLVLEDPELAAQRARTQTRYVSMTHADFATSSRRTTSDAYARIHRHLFETLPTWWRVCCRIMCGKCPSPT